MNRRGTVAPAWRTRHTAGTGLTLIEVMVVIAIVGVLALVAVPSVRDFILMQRLRSINAQLVTDLQFARSEAVQRREIMRVVFRQDTAQTCYALFTSPSNGQRCNCLAGQGVSCAGEPGTVEVRTVNVPRSLGVTLLPVSGFTASFGFLPSTGGLISIPSDQISVPLAQTLIEARLDDTRRLRTSLNQAGRPTVCAPNGAAMQVSPCS